MSPFAVVLLLLTPAARATPLEDAFIQHYEDLAEDDPISRDLVDLLNGKDAVRLELREIDDPTVLAVYEPSSGHILLNIVPMASRYITNRDDFYRAWKPDVYIASLEATWKERPETLRAFVERFAPLVVHEGMHAIYHRRLGVSFETLEEERLCRVSELLFQHRRSARGLIEKKEESSPMIPAEGEISRREERARARLLGAEEDLGHYDELDAYLRQGSDELWDVLGSALKSRYESLGQDWDKHLDAVRAELKKAPKGSPEAALLRQHIEEDDAFRKDSDQLLRVVKFFDQEDDRLREEVDCEAGLDCERTELASRP